MDIGQFIHEFGYLAIALGSFLEGEAVLLSGSFAASQGYLQLPLVLSIAALASFLGDLPYFFAGRRYGSSFMNRFPSLRCRKERVERAMHRHHVPLVLTLRFMYGVRIPGLLALGASDLSTWRFLGLNFIGALIWASGVCAAGYGAGRLIAELSGDIGPVAQATMLIALLLSASLLTMLIRRRGITPVTSG